MIPLRSHINSWQRALAGAAIAVALLAGAAVPVSAKTHHHAKVKIEVRYRTPAACSTALTGFRQVATQLGGENTDISQWANGAETIDTLVGQINTIAGQLKAETGPLQAAELACDGS